MTEVPKQKMWGGRFERPPQTDFWEFQRSFGFDRRLMPYELAVNRAWARALDAAGILTGEELQALLAALEQLEQRTESDPAWVASSAAEDVHHFVEMHVMELAGLAGGKLHTGRSRNELVATEFRMWVREAARAQRGALAGLLRALLEQAERNFGIPMPGKTHLQHAQPILLSHYLHAHAEAFLRDAARLAEAALAADECPMGSGAVAGTALPIDRNALARELGFSRVTRNSLDATSSRDFALDYLFALSRLAVHLSRLAEDMVLFATSEFGFILLPDEYSTGSSLMPQKKNPDAWELIRGKCGRVTGALFALLTTLKGLPTGYQRDLQEDKEAVFSAHDQCLAMLATAAGALAATRFNEARLRRAASDPALVATEAADYLVSRGVAFRQAHEILGQVVLEAERRGQSLADLKLEELKKFSPAFEPDFYGVLALESALARRRAIGGTAPETVRAALKECRECLRQIEENL